jgi:hypothetical protein
MDSALRYITQQEVTCFVLRRKSFLLTPLSQSRIHCHGGPVSHNNAAEYPNIPRAVATLREWLQFAQGWCFIGW